MSKVNYHFRNYIGSKILSMGVSYNVTVGILCVIDYISKFNPKYINAEQYLNGSFANDRIEVGLFGWNYLPENEDIFNSFKHLNNREAIDYQLAIFFDDEAQRGALLPEGNLFNFLHGNDNSRISIYDATREFLQDYIGDANRDHLEDCYQNIVEVIDLLDLKETDANDGNIVKGIDYDTESNFTRGISTFGVVLDDRFKLGAGEGSNESVVSNDIIIMHTSHIETDHSSSSANILALNMKNTWQDYYVHDVVGFENVYRIYPDGKVAWGAGPKANAIAPFQVDLAKYADHDLAILAYHNFIRIIRDLAHKYHISLTLDSNVPYGVKSHLWVEKHFGGSSGTWQDPYEYLEDTLNISKKQLQKDLKRTTDWKDDVPNKKPAINPEGDDKKNPSKTNKSGRHGRPSIDECYALVNKNKPKYSYKGGPAGASDSEIGIGANGKLDISAVVKYFDYLANTKHVIYSLAYSSGPSGLFGTEQYGDCSSFVSQCVAKMLHLSHPTRWSTVTMFSALPKLGFKAIILNSLSHNVPNGLQAGDVIIFGREDSTHSTGGAMGHTVFMINSLTEVECCYNTPAMLKRSFAECFNGALSIWIPDSWAFSVFRYGG